MCSPSFGPGGAGAEGADLGDVVLAVPGVEGGELFERHRAALGMDESAEPVRFGERAPRRDPALVQCGQ